MAKQFYKSKTLWYNLVTILVVILGYSGYTPNPSVAKQTSDLLIIIAPVINLVLRLVTDKKITLK